MRCPRTDFRCCAVFSAGSNPDFDLCATVRDFHPCFPRPTDWLKCEKELFEKNSIIPRTLKPCGVVFFGMHIHIRTCRYVVSIQKNASPEIPGGCCSLNKTAHPCRFASQTPRMHGSGKKMPTRNHSFGRFVGTFCQSFSFFLLKKTWHGGCLTSCRGETTHGLGHNK